MKVKTQVKAGQINVGAVAGAAGQAATGNNTNSGTIGGIIVVLD
jgi:hypothetical protein